MGASPVGHISCLKKQKTIIESKSQNEIMHIFLMGHGCATSKGARVSSFGAHRILFLVEKGATFDRSLFNVILKLILTKKTEAEVEAAINDLIALPSSTLVSAQHRSTKIIHPGPPVISALESMSYPQRQALMEVLETLDEESTESHLSWELLEHRITSASTALAHKRILQIESFGYKRLTMVHRDYLLDNNKFTLEIGMDFKKISRSVIAMRSSSQEHGIMGNDHILFIHPTSGNRTDHALSFTLLMDVLKNLRIFIFCGRKRRPDEETQDGESPASGTGDPEDPRNELNIAHILSIFRQPDENDEIFVGASEFLAKYSTYQKYTLDLPEACTLVPLSCRTLNENF